jgi:hypothetical protein
MLHARRARRNARRQAATTCRVANRARPADKTAMTKHRNFSLMAACVSLLALGYACGDDEKDDGHGEDDLKGDCATISEACHHAEEGVGEPHECHELAHENDTEACTEEKDRCVTACEHVEHEEE